jgi:hypothetical protein
MSLQSDYAFYLANTRKLTWVPLAAAVASALFAPWMIVIQLAAFSISLVAARTLSRRVLTLGRFLVAANVSLLVPLLSLSLVVAGLALRRVGDVLLAHALPFAVLFVVLSFFSTLIHRRVWDDKRRRLEAVAQEGEISAELALALLTGPGGLSFWRSKAGLALMTFTAVSSSWFAYRFGLGARAIAACVALYIVWLVLVGAAVAQLLLVARHPSFTSIRLNSQALTSTPRV